MKVLHVTPYFAPAWIYGGPPRSILGLCHGLQDSGIEVEVVTTVANGAQQLPPSPEEGDLYEGIRVHYAPLAFPSRYFGAAVKAPIRKALATADVCHVHGLWNVPAAIASRASAIADVPVILSPRGMLRPAALNHHRMQKRVAFRLMEAPRLAAAARLHATTDEEAAELRAFVDAEKIVVVPNGVSVPAADEGIDVRRQFDIPADAPIIAFVGRIHPIKRVDLLARAMAVVRTARPAARLVIAGPNEEGHLARVLPELSPLGGSVHVVGEVDDRTKWALLRASAALVLCSDSENFGMSVVEAMAAACPVVVTRTCPWNVVERSGAGFWVEQDAAAIAAALSQILTDPAAARAMGERGKCLVAREYDWRAIGRKMASCYEETMRAGSAR